MLEWEKWWNATLPVLTWLLAQNHKKEQMKGTYREDKVAVQHLQYFSKKMLSRKSQNEHGKETGAFQKTCQVFRRNPLYQIEGDVWKISWFQRHPFNQCPAVLKKEHIAKT